MGVYSPATADLRLDNIATPGNQNNVQLARLAGGGFVATWSTAFVQGGQDSATHCQVFDAAGNKVGAESTFPGGQFSTRPSIASLADGGFVLAWIGDGATLGHYSGQAFTAGGVPEGPRVVGDMTDDSFAPGPQVIGLPGGGYVIGFETSGFSIAVTQYSAAGAAGEPEVVAPSFGGYDIAALLGGFVVTYNEFNFVTNRNEVKAQLVGADGTPGALVTVDAPSEGSAGSSQVTGLATGGFAVSWAVSGTFTRAFVAVHDSAGARLSGPLELAPGIGLFSATSITALDNGDFAVSYGHQTGGLFVQVFSPEGARLGPPLMADNNQDGAQFDGDIVAVNGGGFAVAWDKNNNEIGARIFKPDWVVQTRGTSAPETLTANATFATRLDGLAGNDLLVDGAAADVLIGGLGNDVYQVHNLGDQVVELAGEGTDEVLGFTTVTLADNVENLTLQGSGAFNGTGNDLANVITGNSGGNILDGGLGADQLRGGAGNDTYVVGAGDILTELAGGGADTVRSSVSHVLAADFENLTLTGSTVANGTGNAAANIIIGNAAANTLLGNDGNDTLDGGGAGDRMTGGLGNDSYVADNIGDIVTEASGGGIDSVQSSVSHTLRAEVENLTLTGLVAISGMGNALGNRITGNSAANGLNGGLGADIMTGNGGNDTYTVDNAGDRAIESSAAGGTDRVNSSVSFILGANVETLVLTGTAAINGTGNTSVNSITGTSAANTLNGLSGADTMIGGDGNDSYFVDNALDRAVEASTAAAGTDRVMSTATYTLGLNVENLTLTGTAAINGTGNALVNSIAGNNSANMLNGLGGADTMSGLGGNDTYVVDNLADRAVEASSVGGTDRVTSSVTFTLGANVENLTLTGAATINGTGNGGANTIAGNGAFNTLAGGLGNDVLSGGLGSDRFLFDTALNASANRDDILDFSVPSDTIILDRTIFTGITVNGTLATTAFVNGTAAADLTDRIIYDRASGNIFYDSDGSGAAAKILFAHVAANLVLTNADFIAVA